MTEPDTSKFPTPHRFGTHLSHRSPNFKTHAILSTAKNAVSGRTTRQGREDANGKHKYVRAMDCDAWVYEYDLDLGWVLLHHIPKGAILEDDPWYSKPQRRDKGFPPTSTAVDAAIASIMGTNPQS